VPISCDNAASNEGAKEQSVLFKRTAFCHCPTRHSSFFTHSVTPFHYFALPYYRKKKSTAMEALSTFLWVIYDSPTYIHYL
jgi:hypothetical protein